MNNRYYVAFMTINQHFPADFYEELAYCGLDEMHDLSIYKHEPIQLPEDFSFAGREQISEEAVREMVSRGVLERLETGKIRADFLVDPPLVKQTLEALGEPLLVKEYQDVFPQTRIIMDVDRGTFERFWLTHPTELKLLGPAFEINWLKQLLKMANESIEDTEAMKMMLGI